MTLKTAITSMGILMIATFNLPFIKAANSNTVDYFFPKKFQTLKIKDKLRIIRTKKNDDFSYNLIPCKPKFYIGLKGEQEYYIEDNKAINKIGIAEYVFQDTIAAGKAYRIAYEYAEFTRKLARDHYQERCYDLKLSQLYCASKDGSHVYLYTMYYNFRYTPAQFSVDAIIQHNKRLLLGDLYLEMIGSRQIL